MRSEASRALHAPSPGPRDEADAATPGNNGRRLGRLEGTGHHFASGLPAESKGDILNLDRDNVVACSRRRLTRPL